MRKLSSIRFRSAPVRCSDGRVATIGGNLFARGLRGKRFAFHGPFKSRAGEFTDGTISFKGRFYGGG